MKILFLSFCILFIIGCESYNIPDKTKSAINDEDCIDQCVWGLNNVDLQCVQMCKARNLRVR